MTGTAPQLVNRRSSDPFEVLQALAAQDVVTNNCGLVVLLSRLETRSIICATL
jgi:hypothetical protein